MSVVDMLKHNTEESKQQQSSKSRNVEKGMSLNHLNQNVSSTFDFGKNSNPGIGFGNQKTERGITGTIFSTIFTVLLLIAIVVGVVFVFFRFTDYKFIFFEEKNYYSLQYFNSELGKLLLLLLVLLLLICIVSVFIISFAVKSRFKKSYLSKTNVYIYDIFIGMLNVLIFSLIAYGFFVVINNYHAEFTNWVAEKMVDPEVKFDILNLYKYLIVIIVAIFIALNSLRGISITYEKNKFMFENHL